MGFLGELGELVGWDPFIYRRKRDMGLSRPALLESPWGVW